MTDKLKIARQFIEAIPHSRDLGMALVQMEEGVAVITMPYDERLIGDPVTGVISGGAVSAVMDTCCGAAVMSHPSNRGGTATLDLRIDYMRAATPGHAPKSIPELRSEKRPVTLAMEPRNHAPRGPVCGPIVRHAKRSQGRPSSVLATFGRCVGGHVGRWVGVLVVGCEVM